MVTIGTSADTESAHELGAALQERLRGQRDDHLVVARLVDAPTFMVEVEPPVFVEVVVRPDRSSFRTASAPSTDQRDPVRSILSRTTCLTSPSIAPGVVAKFWAEVCQERVGAVPIQICHEDNRAVHVAEYEGRPGRRPLTRAELQQLFDVADDEVTEIAQSDRKGCWERSGVDVTGHSPRSRPLLVGRAARI
ncbi:MAG: hypothetical protein ACRDYZ_10045 [Acidimicrobiales bacterium]